MDEIFEIKFGAVIALRRLVARDRARGAGHVGAGDVRLRAGRLREGRHAAEQHAAAPASIIEGNGDPISRVGLTVQQIMGVSVDHWGRRHDADFENDFGAAGLREGTGAVISSETKDGQLDRPRIVLMMPGPQ